MTAFPSLFPKLFPFDQRNSQALSNLKNAIIVCDGNSLTAGQGGTPYPTQLAARLVTLGAAPTFHNFGVSGQTTQQMSNDAASQIDSLYNPAKYCILIAWEIGNDIYFNGNETSAITNFDAYCNARLAVGWHVVRVGIMDRYQTPVYSGGTIADYRTKLRSADTILATRPNYVNLYADARLADATNTTYFVDNVHCSTAGYAVVARLIQTRLLAGII